MKAFCRKCNKVTDFEKKTTMLRAGDHGFHKSVSWMCKECGYMPLFAPTPVTPTPATEVK